jgi:hypothetical protein
VSAFANYFVARLLAMGKTVYYSFEMEGLVLEPSAGGRPPRATRYDKEILPRFKTLVRNADAEDSWCVLDAMKPIGSWPRVSIISCSQSQLAVPLPADNDSARHALQLALCRDIVRRLHARGALHVAKARDAALGARMS